MKAYLPDYQFSSPKSLSDALQILSDTNQKHTPFAGGTDLMVLLDAGVLPAGNYLNINHFEELKHIEQVNEFIFIGALCSYTKIRYDELLNKHFPMLCEAAKLSGAKAIQNRGTIGGNICNASPAGDTPPALLCYDAEVELSSSDGIRWVPYDEFHLDYKKMEMKPNELLTRIKLAIPSENTTSYYYKVGTRKAQAISKVCFSGLCEKEEQLIKKIRLSWGSMAAFPKRTKRVEQLIIGKKVGELPIEDINDLLSVELKPIDDIRSSGKYRITVAQNLLKHFLEREI